MKKEPSEILNLLESLNELQTELRHYAHEFNDFCNKEKCPKLCNHQLGLDKSIAWTIAEQITESTLYHPLKEPDAVVELFHLVKSANNFISFHQSDYKLLSKLVLKIKDLTSNFIGRHNLYPLMTLVEKDRLQRLERAIETGELIDSPVY